VLCGGGRKRNLRERVLLKWWCETRTFPSTPPAHVCCSAFHRFASGCHLTMLSHQSQHEPLPLARLSFSIANEWLFLLKSIVSIASDAKCALLRQIRHIQCTFCFARSPNHTQPKRRSRMHAIMMRCRNPGPLDAIFIRMDTSQYT
jgi:hypothetical protein